MSVIDKLKNLIKPKKQNSNQITINVTCRNCNFKYWYKNPTNCKGRDKPCPKCKRCRQGWLAVWIRRTSDE
jgi:predicted Zn-ribbon and HTH transcriptional regulator